MGLGTSAMIVLSMALRSRNQDSKKNHNKVNSSPDNETTQNDK